MFRFRASWHWSICQHCFPFFPLSLVRANQVADDDVGDEVPVPQYMLRLRTGERIRFLEATLQSREFVSLWVTREGNPDLPPGAERHHFDVRVSDIVWCTELARDEVWTAELARRELDHERARTPRE
jgi:hypothetical protein